MSERGPWVKVDRRYWEVHKRNDMYRREVVGAAMDLLPWLKDWQKRGVGPAVEKLIRALENVEILSREPLPRNGDSGE